jgi:hypothetical protein
MDDDVLDEVFDPALAGIMSDHDLEEPLLCTLCSRPLGFSTDDQPFWPAGPMCGDCYQAQQMDDEIFWSEMDEGG